MPSNRPATTARDLSRQRSYPSNQLAPSRRKTVSHTGSGGCGLPGCSGCSTSTSTIHDWTRPIRLKCLGYHTGDLHLT